MEFVVVDSRVADLARITDGLAQELQKALGIIDKLARITQELESRVLVLEERERTVLQARYNVLRGLIETEVDDRRHEDTAIREELSALKDLIAALAMSDGNTSA